MSTPTVRSETETREALGNRFEEFMTWYNTNHGMVDQIANNCRHFFLQETDKAYAMGEKKVDLETVPVSSWVKRNFGDFCGNARFQAKVDEFLGVE